MEGTPAYSPKPIFYFRVTFGDKGDAAFQEITGLSGEDDMIEYHEVEHPLFPAIQFNPAPEFMYVKLKKGICRNRTLMGHLLHSYSSSSAKPDMVTIQLLDDTDKPRFTWTLKNALVVRFSDIDFENGTDEVEIDELELRHEGVSRNK